MEVKLKSGKNIKLKDVSVDERDEMLDSVQYEFDAKGQPAGVKMMHSTMTKWIRLGIKGDTSDKFIKTLTLDDKVALFTKMQEVLLSGEEIASD